ncbi:hypothetical protein TEA_021015 [Camellia sinensis var. sinensis]|uniref:Uncharacterized protein n=1 Tax=Camellia sinensis var. sinensis TaxID=542762 RepID=A0A4S4E270_CAMSN|nr:hypothetical protein TEA_021015 [Camellia sinensis var. sinensis]
MNNMLPSSECSSGCESGWTLYLEHSFLSSNPSNRNNNEFVDGKGIYSKGKRSLKNEDEEEDLSMVSDASSGPQNFHEDEYYGNGSNGCLNNAPIDATLRKKSGKRKKNRENPSRKVQEHPSFLDDTASSTVFNFSQLFLSFDREISLTNNQASKENMSSSGFSQEGSATHFGGRSEFHELFGFFQT